MADKKMVDWPVFERMEMETSDVFILELMMADTVKIRRVQ